MKTHRVMFRLLLVSFFLVSCARSQAMQQVENSNFPLGQKWAVSAGDDIYALAASQDWVVIGTPYKLISVDPATGFALWTKDFHLNIDSPSLIQDQVVVAVNSQQIELIEKSGKELASIPLDSKEGSAELISWVANYLFVIRRPAWILEVFDTNELTLTWSVPIGRGGTSVYYDEATSICYITTATEIRAINPSTGEIYWTIPKRVIAGFYASGTLYFAESIDNENSLRFVAYNVASKSEEWESEKYNQNQFNVLNLTLLNESLIISTQTGLMAIDKNNGEQLWKSENADDFFASPVQLDNILYAKSSMARTVFAISPEGHPIGYLKYGNPVVFAQPSYEYSSGIFTAKDSVVFSTSSMVYAYGK